MSETIHVLLVDDEESFWRPMSERLSERGLQVDVAISGPEALAKAVSCEGDYQVAIVDQVMGPPNGTEIMLQLRRLYPDIEVIILTGWGDMGPGEKAMEMGAYRYMSKPVTGDELALNIKTAARLGYERQRRLALQALLRAGQRISGVQSEEELHQRLYEQAKELLPVLDGFVVSHYDEQNQAISFPFCYVRGNRLSLPTRRDGNGIPEYVLQRKEPLLLPEGDEAFRREHGIEPPDSKVGYCTSEIAVPMLLEMRVLGTINARTYQPNVRYAQQHLEVLQAFANQAAVAVQSVRQLEEARQLRDATSALSGQRGKEAVLQTIVEDAHRLINCDFTGLILQDKDGTLRKVGPVIPEDYFDRFDEPRQQGGVTRCVVETGKPMVIPDTHRDPLVKESVRAAGIRSVLAMPLIYGDWVLGVLYAFALDLRYFSRHDVNLSSAFAAQAAAALHNALEEEAIQIWQELDRQIATCSDPKTIYELLVKHALRAFRADFAIFYPYDSTAPPEEPRLIPQDCVQLGDVRTPWRPPQGGLGGGVHQALDQAADGLLIVNDLKREGGGLRSHLSEREGVRAFIALRLEVMPEGQTEPRAAGMLFLNFRKPTAFKPSDLVGLRLAGSRVAAAIQRLHLLTALQQERQQLNRRLRAAVDIFHTLRERRDGCLILKRIAGAAQEALDIDVCTLLEYDQKKEDFSTRGAAGLITPDAQYTLSKEFKSWFLDRPDPTVIPNVEQDERMQDSRFVRRESVKSAIVYPLRMAREPLGLLFASYRCHKKFAPDEVEAVGLFADLAALVIYETRLRRQLGQTQRRLEGRVLLDWVSTHEASRQHSLTQKAATILNYTATLQSSLDRCHQPSAATATVRETIEEIDRLASEIASAPPRIPQFWEMPAELIPLVPLLEEVARREDTRSLLRPDASIEVSAEVEALGRVQVRGSRQRLIYALEALLQNARLAMPQGGSVTISGQRAGKWAHVRIRDTGSGISEIVRDKLFKEPIAREQDKAGMGMGALLAATIVEEHEGSIELEKPGPGDTTVLLPIAEETGR